MTNWTIRIPRAFSVQKITMGHGALTSATYEAKIDKNFAKKLQTPNAVTTKSVGNTSTIQTYMMTKLPEIPNLAITTKIGIKTLSVDSPMKMMQSPPTTDSA